MLLALRYLRPKRTFVSVITVISVIGVMLGVAVLIIVISVMSGFDRQLREKILGFNAHLRVTEEGLMTDYESLASVIARNPNVRAVSPFVIGRVMLKTQPESGDARFEAPAIRGIVPKIEKDVSTLLSSVIAGTNDVSGRGLLVGSSLASRLRLHIGDKVAVYSPHAFDEWDRGKKSGQEELPLAADYEIRGVFDVGYEEFNDGWIVCSLPNAQDLFGLDDAVGGLLVMIGDPEQAFVVKRQLEEVLGPTLGVRTWLEMNHVFLDALVVEKSVMFYIVFFIMIVAAFGIMGTLIAFVVQKTREIGILKALGATRLQVLFLFLSQSIGIGVVGIMCGYGLGVLAVHYRNEFLHFMRSATGFELFPAAIYGFQDLPAMIIPGDIAIICGGSLFICLLAGVLPALNASRLKPVEALRSE